MIEQKLIKICYTYVEEELCLESYLKKGWIIKDIKLTSSSTTGTNLSKVWFGALVLLERHKKKKERNETKETT